MKKILFLAVLLTALMLVGADTVLRAEFQTMGTAAVLSGFMPEKDFRLAEQHFRQVCAEITRMANLYDPNSELSRLNRSAASAPFICSPELYRLLQACRRAWLDSGGAFDISAKPLMDLWGFYRKKSGSMPSSAEIRQVLLKVGLGKVRFNDNDRSVFFTVPGMALDLGGIAKGRAVDLAVEKTAPGCRIIYDLGGNLKICNPVGRYSRIGIRDPWGQNRIVQAVEVANGSCSTSGGYERFVEYGAKRYPHIMDVTTGRPAEGILAVTVIAASAMTADWMSTAVFVRGPELARKLAKKYPGTRFYIYSRMMADAPVIVTVIPEEICR